MDEAGDGALMVGLDRHDKAVGAHGDDRLLECLGVARRGDYFLKRVPCAGGRGPHLAADGGKLARSAVCYLILAGDGIIYLFLKKFVRVERVEKVVDGGLAHRVVGKIAPDESCALQDAGYVQKLARVQRTAEVRPRQGGANILHPRKRRAAAHDHHGLCRGGLVKAALYLRPVPGGRERERGLLRRVADRLLCQHFKHCRQLERYK